MKKIITTLTALTFALGLAAAAQAQVAPKATTKPGEPVARETVKPGDKTKEAAKSGDKVKAKKEAKKVAKQAKVKCPPEKKAGTPVEQTKEATK